MEWKKKDRSPCSLRSKMIFWIFVFLCPILLILSIGMNWIFKAFQNQMIVNYEESLKPFAVDIDRIFSSAKRILYSETNSSGILEIEPGSGMEALEQIESAGEHLTDLLTMQEKIDALFWLGEETIVFVQNYNSSYTENRKVADALYEAVCQISGEAVLTGDIFQALQVGETFYFYLGIPIGGNLFGCWISEDHLFENIRNTVFPGVESVFFADMEGRPLLAEGTSGKQKRGIETSRQLSEAPFFVTVLWNGDVVYQTLKQTKWLMFIIMAAAFCLFLIYLIFLRRDLFRPLRYLTKNIDRLGSGGEKELHRDKKETAEFQQVYRALIDMANDIRNLRIDIYEKEIINQKTQVELYQLQIRPHFFVNVLNNMRCLTREGKSEMADEMIRLLIFHCRYVLYSSQTVLLDEELTFIRNYIRLQNVQHNGRYTLEICCAEAFLDYEIPVLLIQILVENAMKHSGDSVENIRIRIEAREEQDAGKHYLCISVADNGAGFSEEALRYLLDDEITAVQDWGHGIGIRNIRRRLTLFYGADAGVRVQNMEEGGAKTEVFFPVS